jgi:hypothetical protein
MAVLGLDGWDAARDRWADRSPAWLPRPCPELLGALGLAATVVRDGKDDGGGAPPVDRRPLLAVFAWQVLAAMLAVALDSLVIALGDAATAAVATADVKPERILRGLDLGVAHTLPDRIGGVRLPARVVAP